MRKTVIAAVVLVIIGIALALGLRPHNRTPEKHEQPARDKDVVELSLEAQQTAGIRTLAAEQRELATSVEATGKVAPDEARVARVVPLSSGVVQKIFVHLGDRVAKNQPLLEYDNVELGDLSGEYLSANAQLLKERAQLEVARKVLERSKPLLEAEAISQREFEVRVAEFDQAQAAVRSQEAELARIGQKLHRFGMSGPELLKGPSTNRGLETASAAVLRSPFDGVITKFQVAPGEVISAERELFTIVDASSIWVLADVFEKDLGAVNRHGVCHVTVTSYPGEVFKGTIAYLSDFLDPETRTAKLRCVVPNANYRLKLDMFANVSIPSSKPRLTLAIPASAIQNLDGKQIVFVQLDATHFDPREVGTGTKTAEWVEVEKGLRPGEKVVSQGAFHLKSVLKSEELKEQD